MKYNHELLDYGFVEGVEFKGLMPSAAEKIESLEELLEFESELVSSCTCNGSDKC